MKRTKRPVTMIRTIWHKRIDLKLTAKKAVRRFCKECIGSSKAVRKCKGNRLLPKGTRCPFFDLRYKKGKIARTILRQQCLFCMGGHKALIRQCHSTECPLFNFRTGKRTN